MKKKFSLTDYFWFFISQNFFFNFILTMSSSRLAKSQKPVRDREFDKKKFSKYRHITLVFLLPKNFCRNVQNELFAHSYIFWQKVNFWSQIKLCPENSHSKTIFSISQNHVLLQFQIMKSGWRPIPVNFTISREITQ